MPEYRIYTIGKIGRVPDRPLVIDCADDFAAFEEAWSLLDSYCLEIREGLRFVGSLKPDLSHEIRRVATPSTQIPAALISSYDD